MSNEKLKAENKDSKKPGFLSRAAKGLGLVAVESDNAQRHRPPVEAFSPRNMSLLDYALKNASRAGLDKEEDRYGAISRFAQNLNETYGTYVKGIHKPDPKQYGFSKEHPKAVFKWNMDETSKRVSEDLLYVMGAVPSAEQELFEIGNGVTN